jgi:hypothetical protein
LIRLIRPTLIPDALLAGGAANSNRGNTENILFGQAFAGNPVLRLGNGSILSFFYEYLFSYHQYTTNRNNDEFV